MDILQSIRQEVTRYPFEFRGNAKEYFGIWIVNILLSIVTLGVYSAWAKVRRLRYFYGNTFLDGHNFDYHAAPKQILIGRLIVFGALALFNLIAEFFPVVGLALVIVYLLAIPWIVNRGLRFRNRMTSYRNVRFDFHGTYGRAFLVFTVMPILTVLTLGLLLPVQSRLMAMFVANNATYGQAKLETTPGLGAYYGAFGVAALTAVGVLAIIAIPFIVVIGSGFDFRTFDPDASIESQLDLAGLSLNLITVMVIAFYVILFIVWIYYTAAARKISLNALVIDDRHNVRFDLSPWRYLWIVLSNALLTAVTIGLLRPWAAVRAYRYQTDVSAIDVRGSLDEYVSAIEASEGVASGEFMDVEGIDVGF